MQKITVRLEEKLAALRSNSYFSTLSDKVLHSLRDLERSGGKSRF
jgi:hypothetical protein